MHVIDNMPSVDYQKIAGGHIYKIIYCLMCGASSSPSSSSSPPRG